MATPNNRSNASSASSSSRSRPLPVIPKDSSGSRGGSASSNGHVGHPLTVDLDSSGGRRHTPATVSQTKLTPQSSPAEIAAMQSLKQKMTFSNQSSRTSSADSTPQKPHSASKSDSSKSGLEAVGQAAATPSTAVYVPSDRYSDGASEGEITSSVSISAILSKLDSLKSYLKEAESLREQLQQKISEPGVVGQLDKLNQLIGELQQQESSYLGVLLKIMDRDNMGGDYLQSDSYEYSEDDESDEEEEEGESESEEGTPVNQTPQREGGDEGVGDQALSLRAQMEQQKFQSEEEELAVLREQQKMLKKLLEQQKQIQELEAKQANLMRMKQSAQDQIAEAEAKSLELQRLAEEAERLHQRKQKEESHNVPEQLEAAMQEMRLKESEREELDPASEERQQHMLSQLSELKARKEQLDQLMGVLSSVKRQREEEQEEEGESEVPKLLEPIVPNPSLSNSAQDTSYSAGELVVDPELVPGMEQLQAKLRMAEEARRKLSELQAMIGLLQDSDGEGASGVSETEQQPRLSWRHSLEPMSHGGGGGGRSMSQDVDEKTGDTSLNSTLTGTEPSAQDQSTIEEYQQRLLHKKQEVTELQRERDELQKTRERLLNLHKNLGFEEREGERAGEGEGEGDVGREVERQKELYDELVKKTRELQRLRMLAADVQTATKQGGTMYSSADVTGATWGGSTVQSEVDDTTSTVSTHALDTTQDSLEPTTLGGSASLEQMGGGTTAGEELNFTVTRHTPRQPPRTRPHIRDVSPADEQMEKRIKLDSEENVASKGARGLPATKKSAQAEKPASVSAVWPGVIFPSYYQRLPKSGKRDEMTQTVTTTTQATLSSSAPAPSQGVPLGGGGGGERGWGYTTLLQSQLAVMSNMCGDLLHAQSGLIHIMCNRVDGGIQEHMAVLHQYQRELEQYYLELYQSYAQIAQQRDAPPTQQDAGASDSEDPVVTLPQNDKHTATADPDPSTHATAAAGPSMKQRPTTLDESEPQTAEQYRIPTLDSYYRPVVPPPSSHYGRPNYMYPPPSSGGIGGVGRPVTPRGYTYGPWSQPRGSYGGGSGGVGFGGPGYPYMMGGGGSQDGAGVVPPGSLYEPQDYQGGDGTTGVSSGAAAKDEGDGDNTLDSTMMMPPPPPPAPPTLSGGPAHFQSPYYLPPSATATPRAGRGGASGMWNSPPFGYPSTYTPSASAFNYVHGSPLGYRNWPYAPMGFTPQLDYSAPLHHSQFPHPDAYNPYAPLSQMGLDAANLADSHSHPPSQPGVGPGGGDPRLRFNSTLGLRSPSGITAASLQVQAPSSPPSAQSVNLQPPTSMSNIRSGATTSSSNTYGATTASLSTAGLLKSNKCSQAGFTYLQPQASSLTNVSGVSSQKGGVRSKNGDGGAQLRQPLQDEESESSIPLSIPEDMGAPLSGGGTIQVPTTVSSEPSNDPPAGFSVFDALRDTIYSEVATLIANNEARPHFLVELFRELQMLSTDYLRQRALYSMQELVTKFLTEEGVAKEAQAAASLQFQNWVGSASEQTPSESGATTEDESLKRAQPSNTTTTNQGFDYVEPVNSASSISTPPIGSSLLDDHPFASDSLGDTVIRMDKAMARLRGATSGLVGAGGVSQSPAGLLGQGGPGGVGGEGDLVSESSQSDAAYPELDTQMLDEEIKAVMTEVIPILKDNLSEDFSVEFLTQIRDTIMKMVTIQQESQKRDLFDMFVKQLDTAINSTLEKYLNQKLKDCGEELLVDTSEVLFNELAFFRLMQDIKGHPQLVADFKSMTSQTTTENEEEEGAEEGEGEDSATAVVRTSVSIGKNGGGGRGGGQHQPSSSGDGGMRHQQPLDPAVLQVLSAVANVTLMEEEEALGKSRDDDLATSWDTKLQDSHDRSSMSADEEALAVVDNTTTTSSEDKDLKPPPSSAPLPSHNHHDSTGNSKDPTPIPPQQSTALEVKEEVQPSAPAVGEKENTALLDSSHEEGRTDTPPTPLATEGHNQEVGLVESEGGGGIEPVTVIASGESQVGQAQSTEGLQNSGAVNISSITQESLEAQMKLEQQANEGVTGILATIEGPELAGGGSDVSPLDVAEP